MITKDKPSLDSTAESIYLSNADFVIREQCRRREDVIAHENYQKEQISKLSTENASLNAENAILADRFEDITAKYDDAAKEIIRLKKLLEEKGLSY